MIPATGGLVARERHRGQYVISKNGTYPLGAATLPLHATVVLDRPAATTGECLELTWPRPPRPAEPHDGQRVGTTAAAPEASRVNTRREPGLAGGTRMVILVMCEKHRWRRLRRTSRRSSTRRSTTGSAS